MLHNGEGQEDWTRVRWPDFIMVLQWLYDFHPNGKEDLLLDTMQQQLKFTGAPWESVFSTELFPKGPTEGVQNPTGFVLTWHGVNMAEGLKALPATYRFTHNQSDIDRASEGWTSYSNTMGVLLGSLLLMNTWLVLRRSEGECLYQKDGIYWFIFFFSTELCLVVETMFSGSYLYQVIGDPKYLDRVERIAYNALPATLTGDFWSRQYLQQQNQIAAQNMDPNPFPNDGFVAFSSIIVTLFDAVSSGLTNVLDWNPTILAARSTILKAGPSSSRMPS
ncbi:hypothetical protein VKT23_020457 [Stygiomarasmius scandens]|uniref:Uncharacterized protein n=1 Tax=Marasmiellus scandens TaxID=2682957 RepID=A0ABR1IMH3_9AGAR